MKIYGSNGRLILDVMVDDNSYRNRVIMGDHNLTLYYSLAEHVEIPVGAYCDYQNERYTLERPEAFKMKHSRYFEYTVKMESYQAKAKIWMFRNPVDGRLKFSLTATPREHLQMFVDNMNRRDSGWTIGSCVAGSEVLITYDHVKCYEALSLQAQELNTEFEIKGKVVSLRKVEYNKSNPLPLSYGRGNGFKPNVGRSNSSDKPPVEILFVQGGDTNIDRSKYGAGELLLPKNQTIGYDGEHFEDEDGYIEANARHYVVDDLGLSIRRLDGTLSNCAEDSLDCSDIYPKRVGTISEVVTVDASKNFYDIIDNSIPQSLDYNDCQIGGETMTIIFQSGMLAGREFDVKYYHEASGTPNTADYKKARRFEIVPAEIDGVTMPNATFCPHAEDTYAVFNCMLPAAYICDNENKTGAEWDMFKAAVRYLFDNEEQKFTFKGELDGHWAKKDWVNIGGRIVLGGYVQFHDERFQQEGVLVRIIGIKDYINNPHSPVIELSNETVSSGFSSEIDKLSSTEVLIEESHKDALNFTKRRWRDAKETISMLEQAMLENFSDSISPITVQTMQMLVGDESLQFRFVNNATNPVAVPHNIVWDNESKQLIVPAGIIQHMTMGIASVSSSHGVSEYKFWGLPQFTTPVLEDGTKKYYLYAKVSKSAQTGEFILSETAIALEGVTGYYHLLVGVLNSEQEGDRSFVTLYGFSEVLPGRITTERIVDGSGNSYFDMLNNAMKLGNVLDFNSRGDGQLRLKGTIVQSLGGDESPLGCYRGEYNAEVVYYQGDEVIYTSNGFTATYRYIYIEPSRGHAPTETTYWQVVAAGKNGENASRIVSVFKVLPVGQTAEAPVEGAYPPTGWSVNPPTRNDGYVLWMTQCTISGTGAFSDWSTPVRISGDKGDAGEDGTDIEFIYKRSNSVPTAADTPTTSQVDDYVPSGWTDNPQGVSTSYKYEWMAMRTKTAGVWSAYSTPCVWSAYGDQGLDGDGFEYVFKRTNTETAPTLDPSGTIGGKTKADDDFVPSGWSDDPVGVNIDYKYEWVSTRKKHLGVWGEFTTPTLWATYSEQGARIVSVFCCLASGQAAAKPTQAAYPPTGWAVNPPNRADGYVLWMSQCTISGTGVFGTWSDPVRISGDKGDAGEDGTDIEFIYRRSNRMPQASDKPRSNPHIDDYVPVAEKSLRMNTATSLRLTGGGAMRFNTLTSESDWTDRPQGVSTQWKYEWMCMRTKQAGSDVWSDFTDPVVWSAYGDQGLDGDGLEYVFKLSATESAPALSEAEWEDSNGTVHLPTDNDFVPQGWTDDPTGVSQNMRYEYVATRRNTRGSWSAFSTPALWARYSEDGTSVRICGTVLGYYADLSAFELVKSTLVAGLYLINSHDGTYNHVANLAAGGTYTLTTANEGDGYIMQSTGNLWVATENGWQDVGQIRGNDGRDGDKGNYTEFRYRVNGSTSQAPSLNKTALNPSGWSTVMPTVAQLQYLWLTTAMKSGDGNTLLTQWTTPIRVTPYDGTDGRDGQDATTKYTWIRYADDANGSGMSDQPTDSQGNFKAYIGFAYNKDTATESDDPSLYKWTLFKGANGTNGIDGADGQDGQTLYTWIKYADSLQASGYPATIYDTPKTTTKYIGIAVNKTTATESTNARDYVWSKFRGDDGVPGQDGADGSDGEDGRGISAVTEYYAVSSNKNPAPTSWSTSIPSMTPTNKYLWNKERVYYTKGTAYEDTTPCVIGVYGDNGRGITSVTEMYLASALASGVTKETIGWSTSVQSVSAEKPYLYNYEIIMYTDGTQAETDIALIGHWGSDGTDGKGIEVKGVAKSYFPSYTHYNRATKVSGATYLVTNNNKPYIYVYGGSSRVATEGEAYVTDDTGHIYVAGATGWVDAGQIRGNDGDEYEYIYCRTETEEAPTLDTSTATQGDDYVPTGWTDDPQGVTAEYPFEWFALRKRTDGSWGTFSEPALWATYHLQSNPNLLEQTEFESNDNMHKWVKRSKYNDASYADEVSNHIRTNGKDGYHSYFDSTMRTHGEVNYKEMLQQTVWNVGGTIRKLQPSTWYTLSFWLKSGQNGITVNQTSNNYGFARYEVYLRAGMSYRFAVTGYLNAAAKNAGHTGCAYIFKNDWTWSKMLSFTNNVAETKIITFSDVPESGTYIVRAYMGSNNEHNAGVIGSSETFTLDTYMLQKAGEGSVYTYCWPQVIDTNATQYVDGVARNAKPSDGAVNWPLSPTGTTWVKHSFTFKTKDTIPTDYDRYILFRLLPSVSNACETWAEICQPKLEEGKSPTAYQPYGADLHGNGYEFRYAKNTSPTIAPSLNASATVPSGWSTEQPTLNAGEYMWFTCAKKRTDGTLIGTWSTPVRMTPQDGRDGVSAAAVYRGTYSATKTYFGNSQRVDIVKYGTAYYVARTDAPNGTGGFIGFAPTNTDYWNPFGSSFESVATSLLLAELANIAGFIFRNSRLESQKLSDGTTTDGSTNKTPMVYLDGANGIAAFAGGKVVFNSDGSVNIGNGKFTIDTNGNVSMNNVTMSNITANSGTFKGVINASGGLQLPCTSSSNQYDYTPTESTSVHINTYNNGNNEAHVFLPSNPLNGQSIFIRFMNQNTWARRYVHGNGHNIYVGAANYVHGTKVVSDKITFCGFSQWMVKQDEYASYYAMTRNANICMPAVQLVFDGSNWHVVSSTWEAVGV